jgi:hypothetical protein
MVVVAVKQKLTIKQLKKLLVADRGTVMEGAVFQNKTWKQAPIYLETIYFKFQPTDLK